MTPLPETLAFVGSYAPEDQNGIYAFAVESGGRLRSQAAWPGVSNPSYLAVHPGGRYLYAVGETGVATDGDAGTVHAFRIDRTAGEIDLIALGRRTTSGDHPCHLAIDQEGRWVAVSNYGSGSVAVFPIRPDGSLGERASLVRHSGAGPDDHRQQGPHAHSSVFTPDSRALIVADLGIDRLVVYDFDRSTGSLNQRDAVRMAPGAGPRALAFHPDGGRLFVLNELDNTICHLRWDSGGAALHLRQTLSTLPDHPPPSTAADVRVSQTGRHVYVSNRGHDSVAVFALDSADELTRTAIRSCGGRVPRGFGLLPDAGHLLVANQHSDEITLLPLTDRGSDIGTPLARAQVARPSCVAFVPDANRRG